jgi:hypothetical protein
VQKGLRAGLLGQAVFVMAHCDAAVVMPALVLILSMMCAPTTAPGTAIRLHLLGATQDVRGKQPHGIDTERMVWSPGRKLWGTRMMVGDRGSPWLHGLHLSRLRGGRTPSSTTTCQRPGDRENPQAASGGALEPSRCRTICVPADVSDVNAAFEMIPGYGDTIEFEHGRQHVLDECAVVRWGMSLSVTGARGSAHARFAARQPIAERPEVWGNWTILQDTAGQFADLKLALHCYVSQMAVVDMRGGPWAFERCDVRCIGGVAIEMLLRSKLIMTEAAIGGIDTRAMRAQDGLVMRMDAAADLSCVVIEMCGVVCGYGLRMSEETRGSLRGCEIRDNAVGVCVQGNACLAVLSSKVSDNKWACLYCGPSARKVTCALDACTLSARCGFVWLTDRRPALLRTRRLRVYHYMPPEQDPFAWYRPSGELEDYNAHGKAHKEREGRKADKDKGRSYVSCSCPTCQRPNHLLRARAEEERNKALLALARCLPRDEDQGIDQDLLRSAARGYNRGREAGALAGSEEEESSVSSVGSSTDGSSLLDDIQRSIDDPDAYYRCCSLLGPRITRLG